MTTEQSNPPEEERVYPRVRIGGLLRCCIQTIDEDGRSLDQLTEGDTLACRYCSMGGMVLRNGAWEWNR